MFKAGLLQYSNGRFQRGKSGGDNDGHAWRRKRVGYQGTDCFRGIASALVLNCNCVSDLNHAVWVRRPLEACHADKGWERVGIRRPAQDVIKCPGRRGRIGLQSSVDALDIVALEYRGRPGGGNLGAQCAPYRLGAYSLSKAQIDGGRNELEALCKHLYNMRAA
jgi:hypothetical protein